MVVATIKSLLSTLRIYSPRNEVRRSWRELVFASNRFHSKDVDNLPSEFEKCRNGGGITHKSAQIDPTAIVEPGAVVHSECVLGKNVCIGSGTVVGPSVLIGNSTRIGYNAVLANCFIGDSCVIHSGACIGQDDAIYRLGNHVEIGANTCIDRGSWRDTCIGDHCKIDNLVQIGHNTVIGKCCMICGQVGIAGSVTIGDYVVLGGRAAVRDHVTIATKVRLAANCCVTKDIREPGDYGGFPSVRIRDWQRQIANLRMLSKRPKK